MAGERATILSAMLLIIGYSLVVLPWTAVAWARLGRPGEALVVPQVGMLAMAAVAPHRLWAGIGLVAAFAAETAFVSVHAHRVHLDALMPTTEPYLTLIIATLGVYIVFLRRRRHQLVREQIRLEAESEALGHLEPLFASVREEMQEALGAITSALPLVDAPLSHNGMTRALGGIADVRDRIQRLMDEEPAGDRAAEFRFLATDTRHGATVMAALSASLSIFFITIALRHHFPSWLVAVMGVAGLGSLGWLVATRRRAPSMAWSAGFMVVLWAALLGIAAAAEPLLARYAIAGRRPYTPFIPHKLLLVIMPLLAPALRWIAPLTLATTTAAALALYFLLHLGAYPRVVPIAEPWTTVAFALIGLLLMSLREQRLVASMGLVRAESRHAATERRAHLLLALRDQLNSPLQALVLYGAEAVKRSPACDPVLGAQVARLVAMSRRLAAVGDVHRAGPVSFDARAALRRH